MSTTKERTRSKRGMVKTMTRKEIATLKEMERKAWYNLMLYEYNNAPRTTVFEVINDWTKTDIETGETVTERELWHDYESNYTEEERKTYTFGQFKRNCLTVNGGTLERI